MPTKGIILLAWGKRGYGFMAYNLALSIKHFSPNVQITLYAQRECLIQVGDLSVFDNIIYSDQLISDPGRFKASIYKLLPYDNNLYLDIDALCLQDIEPLLNKLSDSDQYYSTFIHGVYDKYSPNEFPLMYWANKDVIWNHYGFTDEKLPATQSSIQFIRKCAESERLFETFESCFDNPIPLENLKHHWGGTQPDELYLNVALAKLGIAPHIGENVIWFGDNQSKRPFQVAVDYYFLSYYGNRTKVKEVFWDYYDKRIKGMAAARGQKGFSASSIRSDKHANGGVMGLQRRKTVKVQRSVKPVQITPVVNNDEVKTEATVFLYTSYFTTDWQDRNIELQKVLQKNIDNPFIDKIINLGKDKIDHPKVLNIYFERPTYKDFVDIANKLGADYSIIANTDIFFDASIELAKRSLTNDSCFALSRYDIDNRNIPILFNYEWSQDVWMFKGRIKRMESIDFILGLPACDNKFAYELNRSGYTVSNPALSVITYHLHLTGRRNYTEADRLKGEVMPVYVTKIPVSKDIAIIQPGKVGDILIVLPIAKHYADLGYKVYWIAPKKYHSLLSYAEYVTPLEVVPMNTEVIDLSFGINTNSEVHKLWMKVRHTLKSFVELKYQIAKVSLSNLRNLVYNRDLQKEIEVWDMVYPRENYILVHSGSDYGRQIEIDGDNVVEFTPIDGYTIFDWRKVIENASEIHCIDSSLLNFVETIPDLNAELFYYPCPIRSKDANGTLITKKWNYVNEKENANS
jgi:hypothetical protein